MMRKIIFLDRDGVINKFPGHGEYVGKVKDFHFLPGSLAAIRTLTQEGYSLFVISNQAGVSKGVYSRDKLNRINRYMLTHVSRAGGAIKKVFYCTHKHDAGCDCRKPKTGSIRKALRSLNKNMRHAQKAFFIGDAQSDIEAGRRAGCETILVLSGKTRREDLGGWEEKPGHVVKNLLSAVEVIKNENSHYPCISRGRAHESGRSAL